MKPMHFAMALLSAAMFFVLAGVFMGVQLELDGTKLVVDTAPTSAGSGCLSALRWCSCSSCCVRCSRRR
jgi:hypothetical protein